MRIVNFEEIQGMLLRVPGLINSHEKRDQHFFTFVKDWLIQMEQILANNHLPVTANVAVLRGVLISTERGLSPNDIVFKGKATMRKIKEASAAEILRRAVELVSDAIKVPARQISEGEMLMQQLLALAALKGLLSVNLNVEKHSDKLKIIWQAINADPELAPVSTHLTGLVGFSDALILLDRLLPPNL